MPLTSSCPYHRSVLRATSTSLASRLPLRLEPRPLPPVAASQPHRSGHQGTVWTDRPREHPLQEPLRLVPRARGRARGVVPRRRRLCFRRDGSSDGTRGGERTTSITTRRRRSGHRHLSHSRPDGRSGRIRRDASTQRPCHKTSVCSVVPFFIYDKNSESERVSHTFTLSRFHTYTHTHTHTHTHARTLTYNT